MLLFTASDLTSITSHIHNWMLFLLWLHLFILSGVISPLISSSILGTYLPGEFIFQCPIFLSFHTVHGVLKAKLLEWFVIPFSSGPFAELSTMTCPSWVALHRLAHSFFELDKAVEDSHLQTRKRALLKHQIHWHPQLGLSLQDSEE